MTTFNSNCVSTVFTKGLCQNDFLVNLKCEMKAGDLAVIRTTESSTGDDTGVKLRTCTFRKSARD